jgi:hypothetical protein
VAIEVYELIGELSVLLCHTLIGSIADKTVLTSVSAHFILVNPVDIPGLQRGTVEERATTPTLIYHESISKDSKGLFRYANI